MESKEMGELLSRIDERTRNIESRQTEEIAERKNLDVRISLLENWRNMLVGAYGTTIMAMGALGVYVRYKK